MAHRAARQRGQALVFICVTTVVVVLAALVMYSAGQLTNSKMKLQNTADAAAYSAALVQARDLNFTAYMNRATIANQVAVAQIVSLTSWARHLDNMFNGEYVSIADTLADMSTLSALWTVPSEIGQTVGSVAKDAFNSAGPVLVKVLDVLIDAFRYASMGYHLGMTVDLVEVVPDVIHANDANADLSLLGTAAVALSAAQHIAFAKTMSPTKDSDGEKRMANVTDASMDLFYKNRTLPLTFYPLPMLIDPVRLFEPGVGPLVMFRFHGGGSELDSTSTGAQYLTGWNGTDDSGLFVIFCITISILGIPVPIPFPLPPLPAGHGAAAAGNYQSDVLMFGSELTHRSPENDGTDSRAAVPYGGVYLDPYTMITYYEQVATGPGTNMDSRAGLRDYYDVKGNVQGNTSHPATTATSGTNYHDDVAPAMILEIERSTSSVSTSSTGSFRIGGGTGGQLDLPDKTVGNKLKALSKAEAYFSRPKDLFPRSDGKTEWGSLYSPYWQPRLVANSILEQAASFLGSAAFP